MEQPVKTNSTDLESLQRITRLATELATLPDSTNFPRFITRKLMEFTGAYFVSFGIYLPESRQISQLHIETGSRILDTFRKISGMDSHLVRSPVDEVTYAKILGEKIGYCSTLTEITFGAIPHVISAAVQKALGLERFIGLAYSFENKLYGTSVLGFRKNVPDPQKEFLSSAISLISVALSQRDAEQAKHSTEQLLHESEKLFRTVVEEATEIVFTTDEKGYFTYANPSGLKLSGYDLDELKQKNYLDLILPEYRKTIATRYHRQYYNREENAYTEYPYRTKSGDVKWFGQNSKLIVDKGNITGFFVIARDITERVQVAKALKESEEKFRTLFEQSPIGIELYDANGIQVAANKASFDMFGIPDESSVGFDLFQGTSLTEELKQELRQGEAVTYQASFDFDRVTELGQYHTTRSGKADMEYIITPILTAGQTGGPTGYLLQVQEITERKKGEKIRQVLYHISNSVVTTKDMEELIGIIHEQLGTLVDTTNFYVAFYDKETGMLSTPYTRDLKDSLTSWPAENSMTGMVILENRSILFTSELYREMIEAGQIEIIGVPAACWLGVPLRIDDKAIGAFVVQSYDDPNAYTEKDLEIMEFVSEQISLSIQRKRTEQDLVAAKEKAQEADRLKSAFLANMSHEIRTPMNGIIGFAEILKEPGLSDEEKDNYIRIINRNAYQLLDTINDIIDISKIEAGQMSHHPEEFDLRELLDDLITLYQPQAERKNIALRQGPYPAGMNTRIREDQIKLRQVLANLIGNAIKFTSEGSVDMEVALDDDHLVLRVKDTGIGIDRKLHGAIFDRFRQADNSTTRHFGGTGLGLSISRSYVDMMGGTLTVDSLPGKGSAFIVRIPYHPAVPPEDPASIPESGKDLKLPDWSDRTILLVEDNEDSAVLIQLTLQPTGVCLLHVKEGGKTVELVRQKPGIHLVLMDMELPDMNGFETTRIVKSLRKDLPVIATTAYALPGDRERCLDAGCDEYIPKPIRKDELFRVLKGFLSSKL